MIGPSSTVAKKQEVSINLSFPTFHENGTPPRGIARYIQKKTPHITSSQKLLKKISSSRGALSNLSKSNGKEYQNQYKYIIRGSRNSSKVPNIPMN